VRCPDALSPDHCVKHSLPTSVRFELAYGIDACNHCPLLSCERALQGPGPLMEGVGRFSGLVHVVLMVRLFPSASEYDPLSNALVPWCWFRHN